MVVATAESTGKKFVILSGTPSEVVQELEDTYQRGEVLGVGGNATAMVVVIRRH